MSDMYALRNKLFKRCNNRAGFSTMFMGLYWASGATAVFIVLISLAFSFYGLYPEPTALLIPLALALLAWVCKRLQLWFLQLAQDDDRRVTELDFQIYRPKGTVPL